jgi:P-type Cu+ transporter
MPKNLVIVETEASSCGCCSTEPSPHGVTSAVDPVCGMAVDPATAKGTSSHAGQTFYFCAEGCRRAFEKNPASFLQASTD